MSSTSLSTHCFPTSLPSIVYPITNAPPLMRSRKTSVRRYYPLGEPGSSMSTSSLYQIRFRRPPRTWSGTKVALIEQGDLAPFHECTDVGPQEQRYCSMRISSQIESAVEEFVHFCLNTDTGLLPRGQTASFNAQPYTEVTGARRRKALYRTLIHCHLRYHNRDADLKQNLGKRGLPSTKEQVVVLHNHFSRLNSKVPKAARYFQLLLLFNAVNTSRRNRHVRAARGEDASVHPCHYCCDGEDSCKHLLSQCVVVSSALSLFSKLVGYALSPSALSTQDAWHLAFLCFKPSMRAQAHAIVIFNWAVWIRRCKKYSLCDTPPRSYAQQHVI